MGKTYRRVPDKFLDFEEIPDRKIKKRDEKRKVTILADGCYSSHSMDVDFDYSDRNYKRKKRK